MKPNSSHPLSRFMTAQQIAASKSDNAAGMQAADDAALAEAILASLKEQEKVTVQTDVVTDDDLLEQAKRESLAQQDDHAPTASPTAEWRELQRVNTDKLRSWLDANGFDVVKNGGGGHNDCLLISLLQHATGNYDSEHAAEVKSCRAFLNKLDPSIERNDVLPGMHEAIGKLVDELNKGKDEKLRVAIVAPGKNGEATYHYYGEGKRYAMIFDQTGHFEAVVPRRAHRS